MKSRLAIVVATMLLIITGCSEAGRDIRRDENRSALIRPVTSEAIFVNGLVSLAPGIGRGLRKMSRAAGARLARSYVSPIEGEIIATLITISIIDRWEKNELIGPISLIGHSYGGIIATRIARRLYEHTPPIPVAYLGLIDGPRLEPIYGNVARVDNFRPAIGAIGDDLEIDPSFTGLAGDFRIERVGHVSIAIRLEVVERIIDQIREAEKQ